MCRGSPLPLFGVEVVIYHSLDNIKKLYANKAALQILTRTLQKLTNQMVCCFREPAIYQVKFLVLAILQIQRLEVIILISISSKIVVMFSQWEIYRIQLSMRNVQLEWELLIPVMFWLVTVYIIRTA